MYKILDADKLSENIYRMVVDAPMVARHCEPGQFIIAKAYEEGERIPLTICDYDREKGTVTIVFQPIGVSTIEMAKLKTGDSFEDFVGPLGRPSDLIDTPVEELKKKKDAYTWNEMYQLLDVKDKGYMFSYFSQYIHGLSISNITLNDKDDFETPLAFAFSLVGWVFNFLRREYEPYTGAYTMDDVLKMVPQWYLKEMLLQKTNR